MLFFTGLFLIFSASLIAIWARMEGRKEKNRLAEGDLSADDFEIIE